MSLDSARPAATGAPGEDHPPRALRHADTGSRLAWFTVTAVVMVGMAPIVLVSVTPLAPDVSQAWVLALAFTMVTGARYAWLVAIGAQRLFEQVFWLFAYVFLGLAPLVQFRSDQYPGTTPNIDTSRNTTVMVVVAVGAAAFWLGIRSSTPPPATAERVPRFVVAPDRLLLVTFLSMLVAAYYASKVGVGPLFSTREGRVSVEQSLWPDPSVLAVVKAAATLPLVVCFAALVRLRRTAGRRAGPPLLVTLLALTTLLLVVNPLTSPRYVIGTALLACATAVGAAAGRLRARAFALALAMALVLVFPYADAFRKPDYQSAAIQQAGPAQVLTSPDFDAVDQVSNALLVVDLEGVQQGRQLLGAVLFWVPRAIWPGKPVDTGIYIAQVREYRFDNLSAPLWSEFYIDGSWPLLVAGMFGLGLLLRRLDAADLRRTAGTVSLLAVLGVILPWYLIIVLRGSLLQSMAGLTVIVVVGLAVCRRGAGSSIAGNHRWRVYRRLVAPRHPASSGGHSTAGVRRAQHQRGGQYRR